jgi:2-dehydro-3-deoxygluconokinase
MPDNPLGRFVANHARAVGVDLSALVWVPYDGVGLRDRVGLNFTEVGTSIRASVTMYDRGHSACSHMRPGEVDWKALFEGRGVRWLHTGGIFTALSDSCAAVVREAMAAAKSAGTVVSYDLNFRSKLWSSEKAIAATRPLVPLMDVVIGNEEDFQKVLGLKVEGVDEGLKKLPVESYKRMVAQLVKAWPNVAAVGTTLREVVSGLVNHWSAILYMDGQMHESRRYENLEIEDRVGGGDGFASGMIYALLAGRPPREAVELGAANGAMLQTTRGDTSQVTIEEVEDVARGASARIKR